MTEYHRDVTEKQGKMVIIYAFRLFMKLNFTIDREIREYVIVSAFKYFFAL